ncbi:YncE family protein [Pseudomonas palleroniana]
MTPDSRKLYVTNIGSSTVTVINTLTHKVETTLEYSYRPYGVSTSADGTRFYINSSVSSTNRVFVYSTTSNALITYFYTSKNYIPEGILASADNTKVIVAMGQNTIDVYNVPGYTLRKSITTNIRPHSIYSNIERNLIYIQANATTAHYYLRYDPEGDTLLSNTPDLGGTPRAVSFHGSRPRAYYTIHNKVGILNPSLNTIVGELTGFTSAYGIACHPTLNRAYVSDRLNNTLTEIDTSTDSLQRIRTLSEFNGPTSVLASPDGKYIYVINVLAEVVSVIRT